MLNEKVFDVAVEKKTNYSVITIRNQQSGEFFSVIPEFGARIKELKLSNNSDLISVVKTVANVNLENRDELFNNAKLSPFAGRIKDGEFEFANIKHKIEQNYQEENNACHGFVYSKKFEVGDIKIENDFASSSFKYFYNNDSPGYPYNYSIELIYKLTKNEGLVCTTKLVNQSNSKIPISDGWHHYFTLGEVIDNLKINLDSTHLISLDSRNIPTGEKIIFTEFQDYKVIGSRNFDSCFKIKNGNGISETSLKSESKKIVLKIWQEAGNKKYNYVMIYTPPDRKSIAIEPMTSNVDSFNNKEELIVLEPNECCELNCGIYLENFLS